MGKLDLPLTSLLAISSRSMAAAFVPFGFAVGGALRRIDQALVAGVSATGGAFAGGAFAQIGRDPAIKPMLVAFISALALLLVWVIGG